MVEITMRRCFVLWTIDRRGNVRHEPTVYTSAHACINEGERLLHNGRIKDYNYSVVMQPDIGPDAVKNKPLTSEADAPSISL